MYSSPMKNPTAVLLCSAGVILAAGLAGSPADAQPLGLSRNYDVVVRSERVYLGDLDLRATPGLQVANVRVEDAVARVCAPTGPSMRSEVRNCEYEARSRAKRKLQRIVKLSSEHAYARAD
jgi:UrcA family protein